MTIETTEEVALPLKLEPGTVIDGKYRVERVLGKGGMGVVVVACHVELGRNVALKLLRPELAGSDSLLARFRREARAIAALSSENTVRVFDVSSSGASPPYIVMEHLRGRDLGARLAEGPVGIREAVDYVLQACAALAEAHAVGVVHRDLKPANIFLARAPDGSIVLKVLDFGISKMTGQLAAGMTRTISGAVMGTPTYMSPEQLDSRPEMDGRTDVWTLGVILFELLTRRHPFEAPTLPQLCFKITSEPAPAAAKLRPEVPSGLDAVIARCLEKAPERRFATMLDLAEALAPFASASRAAAVPRIHALQREALKRRGGSSGASLTLDAVERGSVPPVAARRDGPARLRTQRVRLMGIAIGIAGSAVIVFTPLPSPTAHRGRSVEVAASSTSQPARAASPESSAASPPALASAAPGASAASSDGPRAPAVRAPRPPAAFSRSPPASRASPAPTSSARPSPPPAAAGRRASLRVHPPSEDDAIFGGRK